MATEPRQSITINRDLECSPEVAIAGITAQFDAGQRLEIVKALIATLSSSSIRPLYLYLYDLRRAR